VRGAYNASEQVCQCVVLDTLVCAGGAIAAISSFPRMPRRYEIVLIVGRRAGSPRSSLESHPTRFVVAGRDGSPRPLRRIDNQGGHNDREAGTSEQIVRIVTENCRTLKFGTYGFEEE
jgi:hypothetical protein